ncbi:c-5 sterol desaturase [Entomophthora muscae]|uniref:C-5 sterol desaturase n=1 Tax=Entomophthora muscae TaxID=34485 RepID=A0ACC2S2G9_9FUNG|nr:c-5 sterol desaturase [Entomophthora muscae]
MDYVLAVADYLVYDKVYDTFLPKFGAVALPRDNIARQYISLSLITVVFGFILYFSVASLSYHYIFDKRLEKHPRFLRNQVQLEIECSSKNIVPMSLLTAPFFVLEVRGYSLLYDECKLSDTPYLLLSIALFLLVTDFGIYLIHRGLHHKSIYGPIHKLHHKWIVPTPYASHAFHFLDGYSQSLPYHLVIFLFPIHKLVYLGLFVFVNIWTVLIHDGAYFDSGEIINSASNHTIHHLYFNYNYGQYFTLWDRVFNSYRACPADIFDKEKRHEIKSSLKASKDSDVIRAQIESSDKCGKIN